MHSAITEEKEGLARFCQCYDVTRLEIFGPAARGTDFDPGASDADFLVESDPDSDLPSFDRYFDFAYALREVLGRPLDLIEDHIIRNPYLRVAIDKPRELVYAS